MYAVCIVTSVVVIVADAGLSGYGYCDLYTGCTGNHGNGGKRANVRFSV